jgi:hypothetical protein
LIVFCALPLHLIADESPQLVEIERPPISELGRTRQLAARRHALDGALAETTQDGHGVFDATALTRNMIFAHDEPNQRTSSAQTRPSPCSGTSMSRTAAPDLGPDRERRSGPRLVARDETLGVKFVRAQPLSARKSFS